MLTRMLSLCQHQWRMGWSVYPIQTLLNIGFTPLLTGELVWASSFLLLSVKSSVCEKGAVMYNNNFIDSYISFSSVVQDGAVAGPSSRPDYRSGVVTRPSNVGLMGNYR